MSAHADAEAALVAHWSQLGRLPGSRLHEEEGLVWFETPAASLPYNGVLRTRLTPDTVDAAIERVLAAVRSRGAQLWWVVTQTATPEDLGARLESAGVPPVERMNFMALDLLGAPPAPVPTPGAVSITPVTDEEGEREYAELTYAYWEVADEDRPPIAALHHGITTGRFPGARYLARIEGRPVAKAYLSLPGPPGVASLHGMSVVPEARGRGVAGLLTAELLAEARRRGCHRFVLHATDMAVGVYRRFASSPVGVAYAHATAPLWGDHVSGS